MSAPGAGGIQAVGGHSTPLHCPYCADEDLFPHGDSHGAWECRSCRRAFSVKFLGLLVPGSAGSPEAPR